ncbi:M28 family peptidase [Candidatus Bipolaricaulota bacterium]|nr:M28 family peptidase [Candidatus Bipolaricaulota bacterium]MBS3792108.1 M28 family peptidase [Candidatus Bipolaricaulota bacterium]
MIGEIWASNETSENISYLTEELENRFSGTPQEREAAEYVKGKLEEYKLDNPTLESFDILGWKRGETHLSLHCASEIELDCIALPYSPSKNVEAEIVDLGYGLEEDFEENVEGKIVLVNNETPEYKGRTVHRGEKYLQAVEGGASAFVYQNTTPGNLPSTGSLGSNKLGPIPGIAISKETGDKIRRISSDGEIQKASISVKAESGNSTSQNVYASVSGDNNKKKSEILLGGHLDGHDISPAAEDNASGTTTLLEVARVLSKHRDLLGSKIRFVSFGSEEMGLVGSKEYTKAHNLDNINLMINMDGVGVAREPKVITCKTDYIPGLVDKVSSYLHYPLDIEDYISPLSDHWSFLRKGVPVCYLFPNSKTSGRGWSHTPMDTLDKVKVKDVKESAMIVALLLIELSNLEKSFPRPNPETVKKNLEERGLKKQLEWFKD